MCHKKCAQCECSPFQRESCNVEDGKLTSAAYCGMCCMELSQCLFTRFQAPASTPCIDECHCIANSMRLQSAVRMLPRLRNDDAYTPVAQIIPVCAVEIIDSSTRLSHASHVKVLKPSIQSRCICVDIDRGHGQPALQFSRDMSSNLAVRSVVLHGIKDYSSLLT